MKQNKAEIKEFHRNLFIACKLGDIDYINQVLNSDLVNKINSPNPEKMLEYACHNGHLNIVEAIFNAPRLKPHVSDVQSLKSCLIKAFEKNNIDMIKFLNKKIDSLSGHPAITMASGLEVAAAYGNIDVMKEFLEPPFNAAIRETFKSGKLLAAAYANSKFEIIKYLVTSDKLPENNDIHMNNDSLFRGSFRASAFPNGSLDMIRFLIFDLNIDKNENIDKLLSLEDKNSEIIKSWFNLRDLNKNLTKELIENDTTSTKKPKI